MISKKKLLYIYFKVFICILFFFPLFTQADTIIDFNNEKSIIRIGSNVSILEDKENKLSAEKAFDANEYKAAKQDVPNLGISSSTFWIKFTVKNSTSTENLSLQIDQPTIDYLEFYSKDSANRIQSTKLGNSDVFSARKYNSQNYFFDFSIPKNSTRTFLIKTHTGEQLLLPMSIGPKDQLLEEDHNKGVVFGVYCGIILVMFLYNIFIYISVRDQSYIYYGLHTLLVGITQASFLGYSFKYIWPNFPWLERESIYLFTCLVSIVGIQFMRSFLQTKVEVPRLDKIFKIFFVLYTLCIILSFIGQHNIAYQLIQMVQSSVALYILAVAIVIAKTGNRPAKYYLIAWSILLIGILVFALKDFGILPYNNFTSLTMVIGSALEVILLSFALADKINIYKKEKEASQAQALDTLKENARIIEQQNVILEEKVKDRTQALEQSNKDLNTTYTNLKETQAQLVNAEKMASLGQLTAGIAHEINNPINFVSANVNPLRRDINDMLLILEKYEEIKPDESPNHKLTEINQLKTELDSIYLVEEMKSLLNGIEEGAKRTAEIVKGLKNFSRLDENDLKNAQINEGIDSTLSILKNGMKNEIEVIKEYANLPEIECYAGKMNQVFMNIINNSVQAIFAVRKPHFKGQIKIKTEEFGDKIIISISDNGIGMNEKVKERIFEPFFTTKDVGEGTGLGLSIVYNIIESHDGEIKVNTEEGNGTEFIITLPKSQINMN